jgi:hypothetical protein
VLLAILRILNVPFCFRAFSCFLPARCLASALCHIMPEKARL